MLAVLTKKCRYGILKVTGNYFLIMFNCGEGRRNGGK